MYMSINMYKYVYVYIYICIYNTCAILYWTRLACSKGAVSRDCVRAR